MESGRFSNSGTCFSRSTRGDLAISIRGGSMRTGSCISSLRRVSSTTSSRSITACSPTRRSCRSCQRCVTVVTANSSPAPIFSIMVSHDTPVNSVRPAANTSSSTSVPPVNPNSFATVPPAMAPIMPPGASGSVALRLCSRKYSIPQLATNSTRNPMPITAYERRSISGTSSMRRKPHTTSAAQNATHQ